MPPRPAGPAPFSQFGATASHDQVVYPASQFGGFNGPETITGIQFRPNAGPIFNFSGATSGTLSLSNVMISLSTTSASEMGATQLSTTYTDNLGSDNKVVYSGPLTVTTTGTNEPGGTAKMFDYSVTLQNPFTYNPAQGNLLLDVNIPAGSTVTAGGFGFLAVDQVNDNNDGVASIISTGGTVGPTGFYSTAGPIAQFTFASAVVPEPASLATLLIGGAGLLSRRRRAK